ncbi:MAG: response regulator transcription factor [Alphaproteobacteria bacterium]|nr:response regulator transcription factor [Alphaproteobacteria bacterium]
MRILLGESRPQFGEQILKRLRAQFSVDMAAGIATFRIMAVERAYALIIIGLDVPHGERVEFIRGCRNHRSHTRIMVLADESAVHERVQALEAGADDFVSRHLHMDELVARVKVLMRRGDTSQTTKVRTGRLELNNSDGQIYSSGTRVELHDAERRLLAMMMMRSGRVVSKEMIEGSLGRDVSALSSNAIEQRISRLRRILEHASANIQIKTVRGSGYVLEPAASNNNAATIATPNAQDAPQRAATGGT